MKLNTKIFIFFLNIAFVNKIFSVKKFLAKNLIFMKKNRFFKNWLILTYSFWIKNEKLLLTIQIYMQMNNKY